jgi:predicted homoserine dehydrogenase-like protein
LPVVLRMTLCRQSELSGPGLIGPGLIGRGIIGRGLIGRGTAIQGSRLVALGFQAST